jgi:hypothetical protein
MMWAGGDNEFGINWADAKSYCEDYWGGGYFDWRMPTQDELAGLYDGSVKGHNGCKLTTLITLTVGCLWASETHGFDTAFFYFYTGKRYWFPQDIGHNRRALPVCSGK